MAVVTLLSSGRLIPGTPKWISGISGDHFFIQGCWTHPRPTGLPVQEYHFQVRATLQGLYVLPVAWLVARYTSGLDDASM